MEAKPNVLFVERQTVCGMAFEVIPYLFDWIEFGGVSRKPFNVQPRVVVTNPLQMGTFMYLSPIPEYDHLAAQMAEEHPQEVCHISC